MTEISDVCEEKVAYFSSLSTPLLSRADFYIPTTNGKYDFHRKIGIYDILNMFEKLEKEGYKLIEFDVF